MGLGRLAAWAAAAAVVLALPPILGEGYHLHLLIMATIFVILAASLDLIVGVCGLLSLGHAAFFGIGAYTSALLFMHFGLSMWAGMLAGAVMSGLAAFLLGVLVLKVRGHRFVISTVAFAEVMRLVAFNWTDLTHGQTGLPGILPPVITIPGLGSVDLVSKIAFFYVAVAIAAVSVAILWRLAHSPLGDAFVAVRENENLAESVGISVYRHAVIAFTVGGFFAGIGGSLYAHYVSFVGPDLFEFSYTMLILVMVVMGGKGTIVGAALGALVFTLLPEYLRITEAYRLVFFGGILIVAVLFFPRGLIEILLQLGRQGGRGAGPLGENTPHA